MAEDQTRRGGLDVTALALYGVAALTASILGLALAALIFGTPGGDRPAADPRGGPFELVDHRGRPADQSLLEGRLSLVYFGFTHCPDICPTELVNMIAARREAQARGLDPQLVFVSVDPTRDTPEQLAGYIAAFGEGVVGLTGAPDKVAEMAKAYGVAYQAGEPEDGDPAIYDVAHTTLLYAVGPDARVFWRFPGATPPDVVAKRLAELTPSG